MVTVITTVAQDLAAAIRLRSLLVCLAALLIGCQTTQYRLEPAVTYSVPMEWGQRFPTAFTPLSQEEYRQSWGKELVIGSQFACEQDYYRAITSFKRALFLLPSNQYPERRKQIEYGIVLSYYLGFKYQETIQAFESSSLIDADPSFPSFNDLLILLYDSYQHIGEEARAAAILNLMETQQPDVAKKMKLSEAIRQADVQKISDPEFSNFEMHSFLDNYYRQSKSIPRARALNAVLPGAGYFYVGQKQAAVTSFVMNSLFLAASYYFFSNHNVPAGIITLSLESGWYLGGINGAGLAAKEYNERLYEGLSKDFMCQNKLFPVLMLNYAF